VGGEKVNKQKVVFWVTLILLAALAILLHCGCASENLKREAFHLKRDTGIIAARDESPEAQRAAKGASAISFWTGMPEREPQIDEFEIDTYRLTEEAQGLRSLFSGIGGLFSGLSGTDGLLGGLAGLLLAAWQFYRARQKQKMITAQIQTVENMPDGITQEQLKGLIQKKMTSAGLEPKFHEIVKKTTK
jgi:hypothetical protein